MFIGVVVFGGGGAGCWQSLLYSAVAGLGAGSRRCSSVDGLVFAGVVVFSGGGTGFTLVLVVVIVHQLGCAMELPE